MKECMSLLNGQIFDKYAAKVNVVATTSARSDNTTSICFSVTHGK